MVSSNFERKLEKARNMFFSWSKRTLTLRGKITIIKSQVVPLFTHLFIALPSPDKQFFNCLNTMLFRFIWSGKCDKITRLMLINDYHKGGLKMIDLVNYNKYMKIKWIKRLLAILGQVISLSL